MVEAEVPTRNQVRLCPLCFLATQPRVPKPQPTSTQPQGGILFILEPQELGGYSVSKCTDHSKGGANANPDKMLGSFIFDFHADSNYTNYYCSQADDCCYPLAEHGRNLKWSHGLPLPFPIHSLKASLTS